MNVSAETDLFHCGDDDTLFTMLVQYQSQSPSVPYDYTPRGAAARLKSVLLP